MSNANYPRAIARVLFVDGVTRDVFEDIGGRQFVLDDAGDLQYGVWILPKPLAELDGGDDLDDGPLPDAVVSCLAGLPEQLARPE